MIKINGNFISTSRIFLHQKDQKLKRVTFFIVQVFQKRYKIKTTCL